MGEHRGRDMTTREELTPGTTYQTASPGEQKPPPTAGWNEVLTSLQAWCDNEGAKLGAIDGYDYHSGEEAAYRHVAIEIGKRLEALRREAPDSSGVAVHAINGPFASPAPDAGGGVRTPDPLDDLVARFSNALLAKLKLARANGRSGWEKDDWETDCQRGLLRHVEKGDPRDVAAYCAFMWHHGWATTLSTPSDVVNESAAPLGNDYYAIQSALSPHMASSTELMAAMSSIWPLIKSPPVVNESVEVRLRGIVPLADHAKIGMMLVEKVPHPVYAAIVTITAHCAALQDDPSPDKAFDIGGCISQECMTLAKALSPAGDEAKKSDGAIYAEISKRETPDHELVDLEAHIDAALSDLPATLTGGLAKDVAAASKRVAELKSSDDRREIVARIVDPLGFVSLEDYANEHLGLPWIDMDDEARQRVADARNERFSELALEAAAAHVLRELDDRGLLKDVGDDLFSEIANDVAQSALTAALAVDGVALVPVEPSDDILKAGYESMFDDKYNGTQAPLMYAVWSAMLAAASEGEERNSPPQDKP